MNCNKIIKKAQKALRNYANNGILEPFKLSYYDFQFRDDHK